MILTLAGPSGAVPALTGTPKPGDTATLTQNGTPPVARLYCQAEGPEGAGGDPDFRLRLLLCLAPSLHNNLDRGMAPPAGRWLITLDNRDATPFTASLSVQTDQAVFPHSLRELRSYFDDPDYGRFDAAGRPLDIPPDEVPGSTVTRYGTVNASAVSDQVLCIGGYRVSDGKPASYSASGDHGVAPPGGHGPPAHLTAAAPSDDAATLFGTLAAGGRRTDRWWPRAAPALPAPRPPAGLPWDGVRQAARPGPWRQS